MVTATDRLNGVFSSLAVKAPCVAVAIANTTLSGEQTVNGVAVTTGDRVLVTAQTNSIENGIYDVSTSAWTRAADFDGNRDVVKGTLVSVNRTSGADVFYQVTTANPITIGTSTITFFKIDDPNITYPQTSAENTAGITPTNTAIEPLNVKRYGAIGDGVNDDTTAIVNAIAVAVAASPDANNAWGTVFFPSGTYMVTKFTVPPRVSLLGDAKDTVAIKQISGTSGTMVRHDAYSITVGNVGKTRIEELSFLGNNNGNDWVVELGNVSEATFWGNEALMRRCVVTQNAGGGGLYVRGNVSYLENIECKNCDTNLEIGGSNVFANNILANQCTDGGTDLLISGDSHRIFGVHFEDGTIASTMTAMDITGDDNLIAGVSFSVGGTTAMTCVNIQSGAIRNRILSMRFLALASGTFPTIVSDATTGKTTTITAQIFDYDQQNKVPILEIGNSDLTSNTYTMTTNTAERVLLWTGNNASALIRLPTVGDTFREITVMNGSSVPLSITSSAADSTGLFYGSNGVEIKPQQSATFNTNGANWYVNGLGLRALGETPATFTASDATPSVQASNVWLTHTGTLTITDFDDGVSGQEITVISKGAITFDTTGTNLNGSSADIVTASGDVTRWVCEDGTDWRLIAFVDSSADNSSGA